ncbi:MAG: SDR family NAD(P)-dependent oxidoreductase [Chloroflexota bacterium]
MTNKTILITGSTDGIGKATALHLGQTGDIVTIVGRNAEKGRKAQQIITQATGASVSFVAVDLSLMSEVR